MARDYGFQSCYHSWGWDTCQSLYFHVTWKIVDHQNIMSVIQLEQIWCYSLPKMFGQFWRNERFCTWWDVFLTFWTWTYKILHILGHSWPPYRLWDTKSAANDTLMSIVNLQHCLLSQRLRDNDYRIRFWLRVKLNRTCQYLSTVPLIKCFDGHSDLQNSMIFEHPDLVLVLCDTVPSVHH